MKAPVLLRTNGAESAGFISLVSPVQVRPPLLFDEFQIDHESAEEHHSRRGHSASDLKCYLSGQLEYYHRKVRGSAPPRESSALRHGTLIHLWCEFGAEQFWKTVGVLPADVLTASGARGKASREFEEEQGGDKTWITPSEEALIVRQTEGILLNPEAAELLAAATDREFNCRWKWLGYDMRCRGDSATPRWWVDIKTTKEVDTHRAGWEFRKYRYDIQDAVYRSARRASGMWPDEQMRFIVTSTTWPHRCTVTTLPVEVTNQAEQVALRTLAEIEARMDWDSWLPDEYGQTVEMDWPYMRGSR